MKAKSLQDLAAMRKHLAEEEKLRLERAAARADAERRAHAERDLFQRVQEALLRNRRFRPKS